MKDSIYFSHDADARSDEKIISLIMAHGYEGYGIFWAVVEMLRTATNYRMQLDSKRIAFALHADEEKVKSVLCDFKLFECKAVLHEEMFFSKSLNRRMKLKEEISEKRRNAAMSRWNSPAKAMQMHSKSIASVEQVQCNKGKKVKERKKEKKGYTDDAYRVAEYLLSQIRSHRGDYKRPNLEAWATDIDLAIRVDKRQPRELCEVAKWAHTNTDDPFWRPNLLSGKKLREKFDTIRIKMNNKPVQPEKRTGPPDKYDNPFLEGLRKKGYFDDKG